ncbi:hypothetical protein D3C86_1390560 [compost metagenome]
MKRTLKQAIIPKFLDLSNMKRLRINKEILSKPITMFRLLSHVMVMLLLVKMVIKPTH